MRTRNQNGEILPSQKHLFLKSESSRAKLLFAFLLLLSFLTMVYYGNQKEGYHVDEVYSYGLANSEYLPFMHFGESGYDVKDWMLEYGAGESFGELFGNLWKDYQILKECNFNWRDSVIYQDYLTAQANSADTRTSTWVSGQDYVDYVAVSKSNTFNYASVYYNQRGDVHPPLYYIALHTICSFFPGIFSPWFGLSINILFLILTLVVLYRMVRDYLGGTKVALIVTAVYGLSHGIMTTAMFLRMYALLTLMVMACCAVHVKIYSENFKLKGKNTVLLMLTVLGGYMTHYYFVLYAIGIAVVFLVLIVIRRNWTALLKYILLLTSTAAIGICIWPFSIRHVFKGYRGTEALQVLGTREFYFIKIRLMFQQIAYQVMGGRSWILWLVIAAVAFVCIFKRLRRLPLEKGAIVFLPIIFYVVMVSQVVPLFVERYVMCAFPFMCLFVVAGGSFCAKKCLKGSWAVGCMAALGLLLVIQNNAYLYPPENLNPGGQETVRLPDDTDCIYVLPEGDWNESAVDSTILAQCRNVAVTYPSSLESLAVTYEYQSGDTVLISILKNMDVESVLQDVKRLFRLEALEEVKRQEGALAIHILLSEN